MDVCASFAAVLASFRGTVQHGLPLEIGDTVQILEKCEGMVLVLYTSYVEATFKLAARSEKILKGNGFPFLNLKLE